MDPMTPNDVQPNITILRGLPGSGKTTLARKLAGAPGIIRRVISADDYFMSDGLYLFNPKEIAAAHAWNQKRCQKLMEKREDIIVDNTNVCLWEMREYVRMARDYAYSVTTLTMQQNVALEELATRNAHGVPLAAIKGMASRWEALPTEVPTESGRPFLARLRAEEIEAILAAKAPWE